MSRVLALLLLLLWCGWAFAQTYLPFSSGGSVQTAFYFANAGNDANSCATPALACQTIGGSKLGRVTFNPGTTLFFNSGDSFVGCVGFYGAGSFINFPLQGPLTITNYGTGLATDGTNRATITSNCTTAPRGLIIETRSINNVNISNLILRGNSGSTACGIIIDNPSSTLMHDITVNNIDIGGFWGGTSGSNYCAEIWLIGFPGTGGINNVTFSNIVCHGATISALDQYCINGFGNGQNLTNVTYKNIDMFNLGGQVGGDGTGILVNGVNGGTVNHVRAYNNAYNVGNACGGAYGVETVTSNNITIQNSEVYNYLPNGATGGCDEGGFDADNGSTNIIIQFNYAHRNYGPCILEHGGTQSGFGYGPVTAQYNICENNVSETHDLTQGEIAVVATDVQKMGVHNNNNTIYHCNNANPVRATNVSFVGSSNAISGELLNNIFVQCPDQFNISSFIYPGTSTSTIPNILLNGNDYFSTGSPGTINYAYQYSGGSVTSFSAWQADVGEANGVTVNPLLSNGGSGGNCSWTPSQGTGPQPCPSAYQLTSSSTLIGAGVFFTLHPSQDYYGIPIPHTTGTGYNIGAYGGNPNPITCPNGVSGDGCTAGQTDPAGNSIPGPPITNANSVQHSNFFTSYALQSSQTYAATPSWNVAGVHYPVGIGSSTYSGSLTAAVTAGGLSNIANCKGPNDAGGTAGQVNCATNQGAGGLTINGFDFSNSGHCLNLSIDNQTGPITVTNNKFADNSQTSPDCGQQGQILNIGTDNTGSANVSYNTWVGAPACDTGTTNFPSSMLAIQNIGAQTIEYNAIQCTKVQGISSNNASTLSEFFNYIEHSYGSGSTHGDGTFVGPTTAAAFQSYNTALTPSTSGGATCEICIDNGFSSQTYFKMTISNNTMVSNKISGGVNGISPGLTTATHANTYTNGLVVNNNWGDCSGSPNYFSLSSSGSGTVSGTGNKSLVSGNTLANLSNDWTHNYTCP